MKHFTLISEFSRFCADAAAQGWHERNGGNVSMRVDAIDASGLMAAYRTRAENQAPIRLATEQDNTSAGGIASYGECDGSSEGRPSLERHSPLQQFSASPSDGMRTLLLAEAQPSLAGACFLVTASGSYLREVPGDFARTTGLVRISADGTSVELLAGFAGDGRPTSELAAHLCVYAARPQTRVVYHAHPASLIVLSHVVEPTPFAMTSALWHTFTECPLFCPQGVGALDFMVPGSAELAHATAAQCESYPAVVWALHGILTCGNSLREVFGLVETLEKAAGIALRLRALGGEGTQGAPSAGQQLRTLGFEQLRALDEELHLGLNRVILEAMRGQNAEKSARQSLAGETLEAARSQEAADDRQNQVPTGKASEAMHR